MHLLLQTSLPPERALRKKEYSLSLSTVIFPLYSKTVSPLTLLSPAFCCEFYHLLLLLIILLLQNSSQIRQSERDGQFPPGASSWTETCSKNSSPKIPKIWCIKEAEQDSDSRHKLSRILQQPKIPSRLHSHATTQKSGRKKLPATAKVVHLSLQQEK